MLPAFSLNPLSVKSVQDVNLGVNNECACCPLVHIFPHSVIIITF